jgi:multisubunit Na+/H+ antiporter MnhB subunit
MFGLIVGIFIGIVYILSRKFPNRRKIIEWIGLIIISLFVLFNFFIYMMFMGELGVLPYNFYLHLIPGMAGN